MCELQKNAWLHLLSIKNKVPLLHFQPPNLVRSVFLALPNRKLRWKGFSDMKSGLAASPYYKASTTMDPLYHLIFLGACSLYLLSVCFRLSTSTCSSSFGGMNSGYWSGFPWKCLGVSFSPGSPWPVTDPLYQSLVYPSYWGLCFGSKFLDNKIYLWHLIWPSGWNFFSRILFFLWQGPWERLWLSEIDELSLWWPDLYLIW